MALQRFTLLRHGQTTYNAAGRLNGDPTIPVLLDAIGRAQCARVADLLDDRAFDAAVHTGFPRTRESLELVLRGRPVPRIELPEFGDVRVGIFEGRPVVDYRDWRRGRAPSDRPPGGESRLDALARYLNGTERLLAVDGHNVVAVLHDVPIRFLANATRDEDPLDGEVRSIPNMSVTEFDGTQLRRAVDVMRRRLLDTVDPVPSR